jgi:hypothetical protein
MKQELANYLNAETDKLKAEQKTKAKTPKNKITYFVESSGNVVAILADRGVRLFSKANRAGQKTPRVSGPTSFGVSSCEHLNFRRISRAEAIEIVGSAIKNGFDYLLAISRNPDGSLCRDNISNYKYGDWVPVNIAPAADDAVFTLVKVNGWIQRYGFGAYCSHNWVLNHDPAIDTEKENSYVTHWLRVKDIRQEKV